MSDLTYREAAEYLNVSPATIRNWIRQGVLPSGPGPGIPRRSLNSFKRGLASGKSRRLTSRANKISASGSFIPEEYAPTGTKRSLLQELCRTPEIRQASPATVLYTYFLNIAKGFDGPNRFRMERELALWHTELGALDVTALEELISSLSLPEMTDRAGFLYQMLQREGRKSTQGSYYTPPILVEDILRFYHGQWSTFLDPCCGSGIFLLTAARLSGSPLHVTGWDTDSTAVHIARLNLMMQFPKMNFEPRISVRNSLTENSFDKKFDLIATNPPWGHYFPDRVRKDLKNKYPEFRSGESFSYFLKGALKYLRSDGTLSFLLPEAFLNVKTHRDIREDLVKNCSFSHVVFLGRIFSKVQTPVIRVDIRKVKTTAKTAVQRGNRIYSVDSSRFSRNPDCIYDLNMTDRDSGILSRVFSHRHSTLKNNSVWILGVVSGNNRRFISDMASENAYPIVSGKDISPFRIEKPERFIAFDRDVLQQSAPLEQYRLKPKIIYRFITGKPVFALDREGYITLNSANSFHPETEVEPEIIAALFNSSLYRFILKKKFNSIKVLRSHLEYLPIPDMREPEKEELLELSRKGEQDALKALEKINERVFNLFQINHSDRNYIREIVP